jgi:hypothetical protein
MARTLKAEELLAGAQTEHSVEVPAHLVGNGTKNGDEKAGRVVLRPLTVRDIHLVSQAAREQAGLTSIFMVQMSLVNPAMSVDQVSALPAGLVEFLLREVNRVSGLSMDATETERAVRAPLARACFVLSREFGWTPEQCSQLTLGQILLYLEMLGNQQGAGAS